MIISYLLLLLSILLFFYVTYSETCDCNKNPTTTKLKDGDGPLLYKGRGSVDDNVNELLTRIDWTADFETRRSPWKRCYMAAFISMIFLLQILYPWQIPPPLAIITIILVVFIVCSGMYQFYRYHCDIYTTYYIKNNVALIRQQLNLPALQEIGDPLIGPPDPIQIKRIVL